MDSLGLELYKLVRNKDYKWIDTIVTQLRQYWTPIYPLDLAAKNRQYLNGMQSLKPIEEKFKPTAFKKGEVPFKSLPIMHKVMNNLAETIIQAPPKCEVRATDPTAISEKKKDINLLKTRKIYEQGLNRATGKIGEPPAKLDLSKAKSNIKDFDQLQLDDNDPEDLSVFETHLQRLDYEIHAQSAINSIFKVNKFDEFNLRESVMDIGATLACCYDTYVDKLTGQENIRRIVPENTRGIWGNSYDGSDDIVKGYEESVPLRTFLGMVGDKFNMERDWSDLIFAINATNRETFTGFRYNGYDYDTWGVGQYTDMHDKQGCKGSKILPFNVAYHYQVSVGKMQFYAPDAISDYMVDRTTDAIISPNCTYDDWVSDKKMFKQYNWESEIKWKAYNAIFLAYGQTTQKIYEYGEVYLQQPLGADDEYCIGTLKYYRIPGVTIAEVAKPYIDIANEAFYKIKWILNSAKPRAKTYVFNELIAMARALGTDKNGLLNKDGNVQANTNDSLENVFNYLENKVEYDIRFYPQVRGQDVPQLPSLKSAEEGIDPLMMAMLQIEQWAESQVLDKIGLNDARLGNIKNEREGFKQNQLETQQSLTSTGYIYRLIQFTKKDIATSVLTSIHDVIRYEQSLACKWLKMLIGDEAFEGLKQIKDVTPHRLGVFVNDYLTEKRKQEIEQAAAIALQKGEIIVDQWIAITSSEDYKREAKLLSIYKRKEDKKKRKQEIENFKMQEDAKDKAYAREKELLQMKIKGDIDKNGVMAKGQMYVADANNKTKEDITDKKIEHEPSKQQTRVEGQKELSTHKADLKEQESY